MILSVVKKKIACATFLFFCVVCFCCIFCLISLFFVCLIGGDVPIIVSYLFFLCVKVNHLKPHPFKAPAPPRSDFHSLPPLSWLLTSCPSSRAPRVSRWAQLERDHDEMMKCCAVIPPQCTHLSGVLWTSPLASRYWSGHLTPEGESGVRGQMRHPVARFRS